MEVVWFPQRFLRPDFACVNIQLADDYALASQAEYAACTLKDAVRRSTSFVCHMTNGYFYKVLLSEVEGALIEES